MLKKIQRFYFPKFELATSLEEVILQVQMRTITIFLLLGSTLSFFALNQEYVFYKKVWPKETFDQFWTYYLFFFIIYIIVNQITVFLIALEWRKGKERNHSRLSFYRRFSMYFLTLQLIAIGVLAYSFGLSLFITIAALVGYSILLLINNKERLFYLGSSFLLIILGVYKFSNIGKEEFLHLVISSVIAFALIYLVGYFTYNWFVENKTKTLKLEGAQQFQLKMLTKWGNIFDIKNIDFNEETSLEKLNNEVYKMIDERHDYELRLNHTLDSLKEANKSLENYAHIVSHDLKTPLHSISSIAQIIKEDFTLNSNSEAKILLEEIVERVDFMNNMVSDLLIYSNIFQNLQIEKIDLKTEIEKVLKIISLPSAVTIETKGNFGEFAIDSKHFHQLIENLIYNSIKYNDKKQIKIEILGQSNSEILQLSFKDNGIGIENKYHDDIFNIFYSINKKTKKSTGTGLAIVKKIVEIYGGTIKLESEPNIGTTFIIKFKRKVNG